MKLNIITYKIIIKIIMIYKQNKIIIIIKWKNHMIRIWRKLNKKVKISKIII